ncbi:hypothetical protein LINGRAHAP2_LOCUS7720 [Linum grandiflorum]
MPRETSPGLKILWFWTLGTAAVLVTTVVRTRLRDMEQLMNAEQDSSPNQLPRQQQQHPEDTVPGDSVILDSLPPPTDAISEEMKSL